jgi:hypothetical protein
MNPAARLSVALLLGLVLWLPSLSASMTGQIDLPVAAGRYLVALLLARVAVGLLARLIEAYAVQAKVVAEPAPTVEVDRPDPEASRLDDGVPTGAGLS